MLRASSISSSREVPALAVVEQLHQGDHVLADAQRDDELGVVPPALHEVTLRVVEPGVVHGGDHDRPAAADRHGAGGEVVDRVLLAQPLRRVELAVVVAHQVAHDAGLDVHLVDVAGVHVEGAEEPRDHRLEHLVHVDALGEVEAGVADELEVAAARVELEQEADVVHGHADVAGETLGERHLLAAELAHVLRPVEDQDADLALERAHRDDEGALEPHVRRERRQRRGVAVGEVPGEAGVGAQRLGRERHFRVGGRHLTRVDAETEPGPPLPLAALEQQQDAVGRVELLAHALQRVLQQLVEVVHGAPAAEDVRARLGELGAEHRVLGGRRQAHRRDRRA